MAVTMDSVREKALQDYRKKLLEHKEVESRLKESKIIFDKIWNFVQVLFVIMILEAHNLILFHLSLSHPTFK